MNIRRAIKEILSELFDNVDLPTDLKKAKDEKNVKIYKFTFNEIPYGVSFHKVLNISNLIISDKNILDILLKAQNIYYINFGVLNGNNDISDDIKTDQHKAVDVLSLITAIVIKFIKDNDVEVITYYAKENRDKIYKYIYNKFLKNDFLYYTAKEKSFYDRIFIKKDLL